MNKKVNLVIFFDLAEKNIRRLKDQAEWHRKEALYLDKNRKELNRELQKFKRGLKANASE